MTVDKTLPHLRVYARPEDPTSVFIWGHAARMLLSGGQWTPTTSLYLTNAKGTPRKPRRVMYYEDEYVSEPDPNISDRVSTGTLIRRMVLRGFTEAEIERALLTNVGGAWWRFKEASGDRTWATFKHEMMTTRVYEYQGQDYFIVPAPSPLSAPKGTTSYEVHPSLEAINQVTGVVCTISNLPGNTNSTKAEPTIYDHLLAGICEVIATKHGLGVREAKDACTHVIRSKGMVQRYLDEAVTRGLMSKTPIPGARGGKCALALTPEGRAFVSHYLDAAAEVAKAKRLAAIPAPTIEQQGDGLTPEDVLSRLGLSPLNPKLMA